MTQTPNQPTDKARSIELLEHLVDASDAQTAIISEMVNRLEALLIILSKIALVITTQPAPAPAPATTQPAPVNGTFSDFEASAIIMTYNDKGEPAYKIVGHPFNTFGVRVWPETLPLLGIDPATLKPGPNPVNLQVRAMMVESTSKPGTMTPKKIIGLTPKEG